MSVSCVDGSSSVPGRMALQPGIRPAGGAKLVFRRVLPDGEKARRPSRSRLAADLAAWASAASVPCWVGRVSVERSQLVQRRLSVSLRRTGVSDRQLSKMAFRGLVREHRHVDWIWFDQQAVSGATVARLDRQEGRLKQQAA